MHLHTPTRTLRGPDSTGADAPSHQRAARASARGGGPRRQLGTLVDRSTTTSSSSSSSSACHGPWHTMCHSVQAVSSSPLICPGPGPGAQVARELLARILIWIYYSLHTSSIPVVPVSLLTHPPPGTGHPNARGLDKSM
jgi:hypothetical protein